MEDLYIGARTAIGVAAEGFGADTLIKVQLESGVLTNTLMGEYDYEGGNLIYTVTPGSRSLTEPETPAPAEETVDPTEGTEGTNAAEPKAENVALYAGVGAFAVVIAAAAVIVILVSKKKKAGKAAEEVSQD